MALERERETHIEAIERRTGMWIAVDWWWGGSRSWRRLQLTATRVCDLVECRQFEFEWSVEWETAHVLNPSDRFSFLFQRTRSSPVHQGITFQLTWFISPLDMVRRLAGWAPPLFNKGGPCVWTELNPEARWSLWYFHLPVALCIKTNYRRMERGNEKWDL